MTSKGTMTRVLVYRCGGQLTLVNQCDIFFSCLVASCIVTEKENEVKGV